jgi:hypothetical protein
MGEGEGGEEIGLIFSSSILDPKAADRDLLKARNMEMVSCPSPKLDSRECKNIQSFA